MLPLIGWNFEIPSSFQGKWKIKIDMARTFFLKIMLSRNFRIIEIFYLQVFKDVPGMVKEEECLEIKFDIIEA